MSFIPSSSLSSSSSEVRNSLHRQLADSGEKDRLREVLRARLVETGWREDLRNKARAIFRERGLTVSSDELVADLSAHGRGNIPEDVKQEVLSAVKEYLYGHCYHLTKMLQESK